MLNFNQLIDWAINFYMEIYHVFEISIFGGFVVLGACTYALAIIIALIFGWRQS